jgi:iron complex transport system permease protein
MMRRPSAPVSLALLLAALLLALMLGLAEGSVRVGLAELLSALIEGLRGGSPDPVVWQLRLPRVLLAALVGAALGVSGAVFQGVFRNPLADPYLLGAAAGAGLGIAVVLTVATATAPDSGLWSASGGQLRQLAAFLGGVAAVLTAVVLAGGVARIHDLILAGVVVSAVCASLTTWLMLQDEDRVRAVFSFSLGSLALADWHAVATLSAYLTLGLLPVLLLGRALDALQLGDAVAQSMGLSLGLMRALLLAAGTLLTATVVAEVGVVGFVGLIVPHIMRLLVGSRHWRLLPASAVGGALLLVLADLLARTAVRPAELPVGVVTTLLGGPFFLYLLKRRGRYL